MTRMTLALTLITFSATAAARAPGMDSVSARTQEAQELTCEIVDEDRWGNATIVAVDDVLYYPEGYNEKYKPGSQPGDEAGGARYEACKDNAADSLHDCLTTVPPNDPEITYESWRDDCYDAYVAALVHCIEVYY